MAQTREGAVKAAAKRLGVPAEEYLARLARGEKHCGRCREWKAREQFDTDRSRSDGLTAACTPCRRVKERVCTKGRAPWMKGRRHTAEARAKMSAARQGNANRAGKPCSPEQRARISQRTKEGAARGPAHPRWRGGVGDDRRPRSVIEPAVRWREAVYARDRYTCQRCGDGRGRNLNAHHVRPWADHPKLRYDIANGITLCEDCHDVEHYGHPRRRAA